MWAADFVPVVASAPDAVDDPHGFARGLLFLVAFSVPLWGVIIALARLAF